MSVEVQNLSVARRRDKGSRALLLSLSLAFCCGCYLHAPQGAESRLRRLTAPEHRGALPHTPVSLATRREQGVKALPCPLLERLPFQSASRPSRLTAVATRALTLPSTLFTISGPQHYERTEGHGYETLWNRCRSFRCKRSQTQWQHAPNRSRVSARRIADCRKPSKKQLSDGSCRNSSFERS